MYHPQLTIEIGNASKTNVAIPTHTHTESMPWLDMTSRETNALTQLIATSVQELNRPLRAVLCWSKLLLSETTPHSPQALDLEIIIEQAQQMNEIIRGLDLMLKEEQ